VSDIKYDHDGPVALIQAASDATRTEAVALVEATVLTGREK
jgi:hypothetical protein